MKQKYLSPTTKVLEIDICCIIANSEIHVEINNKETVDADASLSREEKSSTGSIWESVW
jgi:hypothetical protein